MDKIKHDTDRDNFMTGEQATSYGLIDGVLQKRGIDGVGRTCLRPRRSS